MAAYIFNQAKLNSVRILENPMRYLMQSAEPELKVTDIRSNPWPDWSFLLNIAAPKYVEHICSFNRIVS